MMTKRRTELECSYFSDNFPKHLYEWPELEEKEKPLRHKKKCSESYENPELWYQNLKSATFFLCVYF